MIKWISVLIKCHRNLFKFCLVIFIFNVLFLTCLRNTFASDNQYVTIVNPVRIAPYTIDSSKSIAAEYKVIKDKNLPATWLLTYDVLQNNEAVQTIKQMDRNQEMGLFLEVDSALCNASNVICNEGSWHHANVIFLSGYSQEDRKKLIDTLFSRFKEIFGYYPKSVGSWWTDSYSLSYMQEKYGIVANLTCSDQYSTDGYEIWGQYWMYPYMPSKYHAGMPAINRDNQLDLVTIQWATRDPLSGYSNSLYSTQDYQTKPLDFTTDYFENLLKIYALKNKNSFGQMTVGLEGDFNPKDYEGEYTNQIQLIKKYTNGKVIEPVTMSQFSDWYRKNYAITPSIFVQPNTSDTSTEQSYWYQSSHYRINILYNPITLETTIRDLRSYHDVFFEPYYSSKNNYQKLTINIPSYFDVMNDKNAVWKLNLGKFANVSNTNQNTILRFEKGSMTLDPTSFTIKQISLQIPQILQNSKSLDLTSSKDSFTITPKEHWSNSSGDVTYYALSEVSLHELERKRTKVIIVIAVLLWLVTVVRIVTRFKNKREKFLGILLITLLAISISFFWYYKNRVPYSINQSEIDVLNHLSLMPKGDVLIYDHECLGCEWGSEHKPAVYANERGYVSKYGKHSIVYNKQMFEEKDLKKAKEEFNQLNVQYIYLTRYEGLEEKMPFSPGDFNIEKIYESANGELWRVKEN